MLKRGPFICVKQFLNLGRPKVHAFLLKNFLPGSAVEGHPIFCCFLFTTGFQVVKKKTKTKFSFYQGGTLKGLSKKLWGV